MIRLSKEDKAGLYITVSIHLAVILVLMLTVVNPSLRKQYTFEMDFTQQEEMEKIERELVRQKEINDRLNRLLAEEGIGSEPLKNVAVNRSSLKDDRGTNAEELYREAERIQKEYEESMARNGEPLMTVEDILKERKKDNSEEEGVYQGPSVLSYSLPGRQASRLPIPAYKCVGAGEVTVIIVVDPQGNVISTKVQEDVSSPDRCLRQYALSAASKTLFSKSQDYGPRQTGNIIYSFLAQ